MKIFVKDKRTISETEVEIRCKIRDGEVENIINGIKNAEKLLLAENDNGDLIQISLPQVYYFEAVERHVYAYLAKECYKVKTSLYEIEDLYGENHFVRISKSVIVNIRTIKSIKPDEGRRVKLELKNKEWLIVSKNYVGSLKRAIGMKGA